MGEREMKEKLRLPWGTVLGLLLVVAGLAGLYSGPEMSQYVFLPGSEDYGTSLARAEEAWGNAFSAVSLHGTAEGVSLTAGNGSGDGITLCEVMGGYFEVYPRRFSAGRPLTRGDGKDRVIVLDEALSFRLFGDRDPLDQEVSLEGKKYRVVGVAEHRWSAGDTGSFAAWIPLGAEGAPACTVMTLSAGGKSEAKRA